MVPGDAFTPSGDPGMIAIIRKPRYNQGQLPVEDYKTIIRLIRHFAAEENVVDEAKAASYLLRKGFLAWLEERKGLLEDKNIEKYIEMTHTLTETLRIIVQYLSRAMNRIEDYDPRLAEELERLLEYTSRIVDIAIIETKT